MTTDRLDRIDLLLYRAEFEYGHGGRTVTDLYELLNLMSAELRYLHMRPAHQQLADSCGLDKEN